MTLDLGGGPGSLGLLNPLGQGICIGGASDSFVLWLPPLMKSFFLK